MIEGDLDCVFGSRFIKGGKIIDYPFLKKIINRGLKINPASSDLLELLKKVEE